MTTTETLSLPETVKILHRTFKLQERGYKESFGAPHLAQIDFVNSEISYLNLGGTETVDSVIHEILHGLFYTMRIDVDDTTEERIVSALSSGLVTVMVDNPDLFYSLQDMIDAEQS